MANFRFNSEGKTFSYKVAQRHLVRARLESIRSLEKAYANECNLACMCGACHTECKHCSLRAIAEALRNVSEEDLNRYVNEVEYKRKNKYA